IRFSKDEKLKSELIWEACVIYGTYQDFEQMEHELKRLATLDKNFMNQERQLQISRLYFYGKEYNKSWNRIYPFVKDGKASSQAWILFSDLFLAAFGQKDKLYEVAKSFLLKREKELKSKNEL